MNIHPLIWPVSAQHVTTDPRLHIPEHQGSIIVPTGEQTIVRAKGHSPDLTTMSREGSERRGATLLLPMPYSDGMVVAANGKHRCILVESQCFRPTHMALTL